MTKTCLNCTHYHGCMVDNKGFYHMHDWCDVWEREIPSLVLFNEKETPGGYDDIECGRTFCHAFDAVNDKKAVSEELLKNRNKYNAETKLIHKQYGK